MINMTFSNLQTVFLILLFLFVSGCATVSKKSFYTNSVSNAYIDKHDNLYLCVEGSFYFPDTSFKPYTIVIPLTLTGITPVKDLRAADMAINYTDNNDLLYFKLDQNWLKSGCISKKDKLEMKEIPIVSNHFVIGSEQLIHKDEKYQLPSEEYNNRIQQLVKKNYINAKPINGEDTLYLMNSFKNGYPNAFFYVSPTKRFRDRDKIIVNATLPAEAEYSLSKNVENVLMAPLIVPIATYLYTINNVFGP